MYRDIRRFGWALVASLCFSFCPIDRSPAQTIEEKAQICAACHGENGVPTEKTTPVIWGQNQGYLYIQLRDFKRGTRKQEIMAQIVAGFERDDMMALAEYFSKKPWPDLGQPRAPKDIATQALRANGSIGCTGCHLDKFQGDGTIPRIADQNQAYLDKTIADFRSRTRGNNPGMSDLMNATAPDDLAALAQFLAGF
jgi:cytochrome c553